MKQSKDKTRPEVTVSYFPKITGKSKQMNLYEVLDWIKIGQYRTKVESVRKFANEGKFKKSSELKTLLPSFTPSGLFNETHRKEDLIQYNSMVILDIDKIGVERVAELKKKAIGNDKVFAAFISPSGNGLKILVKTDSTTETHEAAFGQIAEHFEKELQVTIDKSGKDYSRLCFLSYDPDLYLNEEAVVFKTETEAKNTISGKISYSGDVTELYTYTVTYTEKIKQFYTGERNNFIYLLSNNLNRVGIDKATAESLIKANYNDRDMGKEIQASINSAFSHSDEHGIWKPEYIISVISVKTATSVKQNLSNGTPYIPSEVYNNLPKLINKCVQGFEVQREKDIMLTGSITILSGCFQTVTGIYDRREYSPNLFCFIVAPPASGKGVLVYAKMLAQKIHGDIIQRFDNPKNDRDAPMQRTHFIPADSSAAAVKGILNLNHGIGTICETEADTLSSTLQQDWGQYSDLMRKAFQNEPVTFSRLGKKESIMIEEIQYPKLSICLSGTPSQIPALIKGIVDGMFSRFIFYSFRNSGTPAFKNVFSEGGILNLNEYFNGLSEEVYNDYYSKLDREKPIYFSLQKHQQDDFLKWFDKMIKKTNLLFSDETDSIVYRLGLITFRIAMVLTIIRKIERNELMGKIECDDVDFKSSLTLSEVYLEHSLAVYQLLPRTKTVNQTVELFFEVLPNSFKYNEAVKIGEYVINISEKTVYNHLKEMKDAGIIQQPKRNGAYFKAEVQ